MNSVEFKDNSIKVLQAINEASLKFLSDCGRLTTSQTIRNSRVDKGQTKNKWNYIVDESQLIVTIGNPLENAIWEEFGTGEYAIKKNGRKTPWYIPVENYVGKKKPTFNGKVTIVYVGKGKNRKAYYKTNGKKPNRALQNALDSCKTKIIEKAQSIFGSKLK